MTDAGNVLAAVVAGIAFLLLGGGVVAFGMMVKGCYVLRRWRRNNPYDHAAALLKSPLVPEVAVLMAPHEPSPEVRALVRRLLTLEFANHELILVLDGPHETALEKWTHEFHLVPSERKLDAALTTAAVRGIYESSQPYRLVVVDKQGRGTADALNAGVNATSCPAIAIIDPETEFAEGILLRLVRPMLEQPGETVAVCGSAPTRPGENFASRFGALESLRLWLGRSLAFSGWNIVVPWPGCAMIFQRQAMIEAGGFQGDTLELVLAMASGQPEGKPGRVVFMPEVDSRLPAPQSVEELHSVMDRDQRAAMRVLRSAAASLLLRLGIAWDRIIRPSLEIAIFPVAIAASVLGAFSVPLVELVLLATVMNGIMLSMAAVVLHELADYEASDPHHLSGLFLAAILESCGYRQMHNLWLLAALSGNTKPRTNDPKAAGRGGSAVQ